MRTIRVVLFATLCVGVSVRAQAATMNQWISSGPGVGLVKLIIADPTDPNVAYALIYNVGVFKTVNAGADWRLINHNVRPGAFSIVPDSPSTLIAATAQDIYTSYDGGDHWSLTAQSAAPILSLAESTVTGTLFLGTATGVERSTDHGRNYHPPSTGLAGSFAVDPIRVTRDGMVYALAANGDREPPTRLFVSRDDGVSWSRLGNAPYLTWFAVDFDSGAIFGSDGFNSGWISTDQGQTWKTFASPPAGTAGFSLVPANATLVYTPTLFGLYAYNVTKRTWSLVGNDTSTVLTVALSTGSNPLIYTARNAGIFIASSDRRVWIPASRGLAGAQVADVAVSSDGAVVYAASATAGTARSNDGGESWQIVDPSQAAAVAVSASDSHIAYLGSSKGIEKTTDGGRTWTGIKAGISRAFAIAPSDSATIYAQMDDAMYRTSNGGATWAISTDGLPQYFYYYYASATTDVAVDPADPATAYADGYYGLFKTVDSGAHWTVTNSEARLSVALDHASPDVIYAPAVSSGVLKSTDAGQTWSSIGLIDKTIVAVATGDAANVVFAASDDGLIYRSDDSGALWVALKDGWLPVIRRLRTDGAGDSVFAATLGGVYAYRVENSSLPLSRIASDRSLASALLFALTTASANNALVFPISGSAGAPGGTIFTTELVLSNDRDADQDVMLIRLGSSAESLAMFRIHLPAHSSVHPFDLGKRMNLDGIGALVVAGIDGDHLDGSASLSGSLRVWSHSAAQRAPLADEIPALRPPLSQHAMSEIDGLQQGVQWRTNVGIVNLENASREFAVIVDSQDGEKTLTVDVRPLSLLQVPLPFENTLLSVTAKSIAGAGQPEGRWIFYGTSINNATDEAQTAAGRDR